MPDFHSFLGFLLVFVRFLPFSAGFLVTSALKGSIGAGFSVLRSAGCPRYLVALAVG